MDIRITNTCNSDCLYCLEQSLRNKEKHIDTDKIYQNIIAYKRSKPNDSILSIYGGNPLLHPQLLDILSFAKKSGFIHISVLTNTISLDRIYLQKLISNGLTGLSFYFSSFDRNTHDIISQSQIPFFELLANIKLIQSSGLHSKCIIHINAKNIKNVYKDIFVLYAKYKVNSFEFINYFPFDRPYDSYRKLLAYDVNKNKGAIDNIFHIIIQYNFGVRFSKFPKIFFGKYTSFYDIKEGVLEQIGDEDIERTSVDKPFCLVENRCKSCFIQDNCNAYDT